MKFSEIVSEAFLSEMIVRRYDDDGDTLIAFKDSIWVVDEYDYDRNENGIHDEIEKIAGRVPERLLDIADIRSDILVASYDSTGKTITIQGHDLGQHPETSKLIQKVAKQLGIKSVDYGNSSGDIDASYSPKELKGQLPEYGYHGTSLHRLRGILRTGLAAQNMGNWGSIHTKGAIFFAVSDSVPRFHANRTAEKDQDIPVIIKFKIPDQSKIFADYDVASELYGAWNPHLPSEYSNSSTMPAKPSGITQHHKRPQNLWKNMGIFGYKGRISPSMFVEFYTTSMPPSEYPEEDGYVERSREEMNDYMKAYAYVADNFGLVQDYIDDNWLHYSADDIISDLSPEDEEDEE